MVYQAVEVRPVSQGQQGLLVSQGLLATGAILADQAPVGPGETKGGLALLEVKVLQVNVDNEAMPASRGQQDLLVVLVREVFQVTEVIRVLVDCQDCLVQVDRLDLSGRLVLKVLLVQWDLLETLDQQDHLV